MMMPLESVRLLIIGAGKMGAQHAEAFSNFANVELVGIVSRGGKSAKELSERFKIQFWGTEWTEVAKKANANAILVTVSHLISAKICREVIEAGYPIFAEKPVSLNSEEAFELAELAESKNLLNMVGVNRRFYSTVIQAGDLIQFYGDLKGLTLIAPDPVESYRAMATYDEEVYANWPVMNTIHAYDLINLYLGSPKNSISFTNASEHERSYSAVLEYESGKVCHVISQNDAGGMQNWKLILHGDGIEVTLGPLEQISYKVLGQEQKSYLRKGRYKPGLREQAECFTQALINGHDLTYPASSFRNHAQSIEIVERIMGKK